jgi:helicase required for RNAi-mediated heterochromatin assembly 1
MADHIVHVNPEIGAPVYRLNQPHMNLTSAAINNGDGLRNINVIQDWPEFASEKNTETLASETFRMPTSSMDSSQVDALRRILTKELAIVQGPPGTGKTFVSVEAMKIFLSNHTKDDPPIVVAAQTNHAVDQILRLISKYDPEFIRLGGQTSDKELILPRTLFELRQKARMKSATKSASTTSYRRKEIGNHLETILKPLLDNEPMTPELFCRHNLITPEQRDSILDAASDWIQDHNKDKMSLWCGNKLHQVDHSLPVVDNNPEEEFEDLDDSEIDAILNEDDSKFELLNGRPFMFSTGFSSDGANCVGDDVVTELLRKHQDLTKIGEIYRPAVYDYLRRQLTAAIKQEIRAIAQQFQDISKQGKIERWRNDYEILSTAKVIGMTTTGLSKYRGLLHLLKPKIVLIEEAAETLEPYTAAACFDSLEHMILVGDHQQLRAHCNVTELQGSPVWYDMSMFERLVNNSVEFTQLKTQRRMRPEIRELIKPIYPDLVDHPSVHGRDNIPGMGKFNLWFLNHSWEESTNESQSKMNDLEARMIVHFMAYLVYNNVALKNITILTFYNGQKKLLRSLCHRHDLFANQRVNVCTVDAYQGEENEIVILSLVRMNRFNQIGFLDNVNRTCVALSRARKGFFLFGNANILTRNSKWFAILKLLLSQNLIHSFLPLYCPVHQKYTKATSFNDLEVLRGGCMVPCGKQLTCSHKCSLNCHPGFGCEKVPCSEPCKTKLRCGHTCSLSCTAKPCECVPCTSSARGKGSVVVHQAGNIPSQSTSVDQSTSAVEVPSTRPGSAIQSDMLGSWASLANSGSRNTVCAVQQTGPQGGILSYAQSLASNTYPVTSTNNLDVSSLATAMPNMRIQVTGSSRNRNNTDANTNIIPNVSPTNESSSSSSRQRRASVGNKRQIRNSIYEYKP